MLGGGEGVRNNVLAAALLVGVEARCKVACPAAAGRHHRGLEGRGLEVLGLELLGLGAVDDVAGAAAAGGLELGHGFSGSVFGLVELVGRVGWGRRGGLDAKPNCGCVVGRWLLAGWVPLRLKQRWDPGWVICSVTMEWRCDDGMPEFWVCLDQQSVGGWDGVTLTGVTGPGCSPRMPQAAWRASHTAICIP